MLQWHNMPLRRRPYQRSTKLVPIRLTFRDIRILETIHAFDGLLSLKQIDLLFFSGQGRSQPRARMRALFDNDYVQMPDLEAIHKVPLGEAVYWLDRKGASIVAGLQGKKLSEFKWRRKPRFAQIEHDLRVNDFYIAVRKACQRDNNLHLVTWLPESEFAMQPDRVSFETLSGKLRERTMQPDGYFAIERQASFGRLKQFNFLLEIDMGTEDNPRFAREKVRPGVAYLKSESYANRFGTRHGRYLIVTSGERRMRNMKSQTERNGGNGLFYFSTFEDIKSGSVLTAPAWLLAGHDKRRRIVPL